jgi:hypothetical protein
MDAPRRKRRRRVWLAVSPLVAFVALGGIGVVTTAVGGNCAFDLPPGDVTSMTLVNDSRGTVEFVECNNDACSDYDHVGDTADEHAVIPAGQSDAYWNHEDCGREPVGVINSHGAMLGCIILPVADPPKVTTWRVSQTQKCTGPIG